jgi:putative transposase
VRATQPRPKPHRALGPDEKQRVLDTLHSRRFVDKAPAQVWAALLDEGTYHCSIRTMYRILAEHEEVRERRNQLRHPNYQKPELLAEAPNQVWSWDITKLLGPAKWTYFYLYVILDIFSRYVTGWMVAHRESAALARRLIGETYRKQRIAPDQLTIHADRGGSMRSKSLALLLADLGVTKTHSRPHVSNDNPYSEAQFKTLKYCPQFPRRFGCIEDARGFCGGFFDYYNTEHRHSGIGLMTPAAVHYGLGEQLVADRMAVLLTAYREHPERFVHGPPQPPIPPRQAWINPPVKKTTSQDAPGSTIATPDNPWVPPVSDHVETMARSSDPTTAAVTAQLTAEVAH